VIRARDGLDLVCYLTLPPGVPGKSLPMILLPHGGPFYRDRWGLNGMVQWLANRGYAVLQVNFRASAGFGKTFLNAANHQFGDGAVLADLEDALKWSIAQGIADPKRVGIMGGSFGGYATLCGISFKPEYFACAVDVVGPSNLRTLFQAFPSYWKPVKTRWVRRMGDVEHDADLNQRISPLFHVNRVRAPLLIGHGVNDPRVHLSESEQIVAALRARSLPVTFVVYADEGHGFVRPENNMDFFGRVEEFLSQHLGGRCEPWAKVPGSSAELR
jgi:dipeptidyl aminopeptidase/acylaminoacyl peptidase